MINQTSIRTEIIFFSLNVMTRRKKVVLKTYNDVGAKEEELLNSSHHLINGF